jgi:hypothetical protein
MSRTGEAAHSAQRAVGAAGFGPSLLRRLLRLVPRGRMLPADVWERRHRVILVLLYLHAAGLTTLAIGQGFSLRHSLLEGSTVALLAAAASWKGVKRPVRAGLASLGLLTSSGVLVHLTGGLIGPTSTSSSWSV